MMTIDQMYKEVKGYCFRTPYCAECRLITPDAVCGWNSADEISTEDCYWFLVNEGLISKPKQPEINFVKAERNDEVERMTCEEVINELKRGEKMTYKEVLNRLKICVNECDDCLTCKAMEDAIENAIEIIEKYVTIDEVQHPSHYTQGGIECIEAIRASMTADGFCDYCKGNIIKYIWRWRDKGGVEDLRKASVYLNWLINAAEGKRKENDE